MTTPVSFIVPQSASAPITTNLRKDELAALLTIDKDVTESQRVVAVGNSIPIVFGKYSNEKGGVWVTPPAVRYGLQIDEATGSAFSFGLVVSDGEIGSILASDIYQGVSSLDSLQGSATTTTYGGLATSGYDYSLTYTTAGTATVPGEPGYYEDQSFSISEQSSSSWNTFYIQAAVSVSLSISIEGRSSLSNSWSPLSAEISVSYAGESVSETNSTLNFSGVTLIANQNYLLSASVKIPSANRPTYFRTIYSGSYEKAVWVPGTQDTPGTPPVTSNLPLFPGSGGTFAGMTTLAVKGSYGLDVDADTPKQQIRCFVRNGLYVEKVLGGNGSSDNFADLAYYLLKEVGKVPLDLIDKNAFKEAAQLTATHGLAFNGILANSVNLRDYISRVAPMFLLRLAQVNGKFALKPVLPVVSNAISLDPVIPVFAFNSSNIVIDSFQKNYVDLKQRKGFCALMTFRSQTTASFGQSQTVEVRYTNTAIDGPFEQYDLEEFCTSEAHAALIGRYIVATRKHITHTIAFQTTSQLGSLSPTDIISVALGYESSLGAGSSQTLMYQVDQISEGLDGTFRVEATYFPVTATNVSQVALDMLVRI